MPRRILRFRVGDRRWAVPLEAVREVLESPPLLRVPRSRPRVAGLILRSGIVVPVYDLRPEGSAAPPHVLVLEWAELRNGICVAEPEAQPAVGEEDDGDLGPPCRGVVKFRGVSAERVDLGALYRMLDIPT